MTVIGEESTISAFTTTVLGSPLPGESAEEISTAAGELVETGLQVGRDSMVITEAGNLSVRLREHMLITRRGARLDRLTPADLVAVPVSGGPSVPTEAEPSSEAPMHLSVYRNSDAGAVVHTHSRMATVLSTLVAEVPPIHYAIHRLGDSVRVARYATFGSDELAANVLEALTDRTAALMANHGSIAYGPNLAEALARAQVLEWLAELYYHAIAVAPPTVLTPADLEAVRARASDRLGRPAATEATSEATTSEATSEQAGAVR